MMETSLRRVQPWRKINHERQVNDTHFSLSTKPFTIGQACFYKAYIQLNHNLIVMSGMSSRFEPRWPTERPLAHVPGCKYIHSNKCLPAPCSASEVRHVSRESGDKAAGRQAWENGQQWRGRYGLPLLRRSRSDLIILFDFGPEVLWHVIYLLWLDHEARRAEGR